MRASLCVVLALLALGCSDSEKGGSSSADAATEKSLEVIDLGAGLTVHVLEEGTGPIVEEGSHMDLHLEMFLESDNKTIESTYDRGQTVHHELGIDPSIPAFRRAVVGLREGSRVRLDIPSHLGFGPQGLDEVVPPYADLLMDLNIVKVYGPEEPH